VTEAGIQKSYSRMELRPGLELTSTGPRSMTHIRRQPWARPSGLAATEVLPRADRLAAGAGGDRDVVATVQPSASWLTYGDATQGLPPIVVQHKWVDRQSGRRRCATRTSWFVYDASRFPPEELR